MADLLRSAVPPDIRLVRFASPKQAAAASPPGNQGKFRVPRRAGQAGRPSRSLSRSCTDLPAACRGRSIARLVWVQTGGSGHLSAMASDRAGAHIRNIRSIAGKPAQSIDYAIEGLGLLEDRSSTTVFSQRLKGKARREHSINRRAPHILLGQRPIFGKFSAPASSAFAHRCLFRDRPSGQVPGTAALLETAQLVHALHRANLAPCRNAVQSAAPACHRWGVRHSWPSTMLRHSSRLV